MSTLSVTVEEALTHQVEMITHELMKEPDWILIMAMVERINSDRFLTPHILKMMKPRLDHKRARIQYLAIILLGAIVDNCPNARRYVATDDFLSFLVKTLPKSIREPRKKHLFGGGPVVDVERLQHADKLLSLFRRWAFAFRKTEQFPHFILTYRKLNQEGVVFPEVTAEEQLPMAMADGPVAGSAQAALQKAQTNPSASTSYGSQAQAGPGLTAKHPVSASGPVATSSSLSPDDVQPLPIPDLTTIQYKNCYTAVENAILLLDTLNESPADQPLGYNETIRSLYQVLQSNIMKFHSILSSEKPIPQKLMEELLKVNDTLHVVNQYYDAINGGKLRRRTRLTPAQHSVWLQMYQLQNSKSISSVNPVKNSATVTKTVRNADNSVTTSTTTTTAGVQHVPSIAASNMTKGRQGVHGQIAPANSTAVNASSMTQTTHSETTAPTTVRVAASGSGTAPKTGTTKIIKRKFVLDKDGKPVHVTVNHPDGRVLTKGDPSVLETAEDEDDPFADFYAAAPAIQLPVGHAHTTTPTATHPQSDFQAKPEEKHDDFDFFNQLSLESSNMNTRLSISQQQQQQQQQQQMQMQMQQQQQMHMQQMQMQQRMYMGQMQPGMPMQMQMQPGMQPGMQMPMQMYPGQPMYMYAYPAMPGQQGGVPGVTPAQALQPQLPPASQVPPPHVLKAMEEHDRYQQQTKLAAAEEKDPFEELANMAAL